MTSDNRGYVGLCQAYFRYRFKGTTFSTVWKGGVFMIIYTTIIVILHNYVDGLKLNYPLGFMSIIGFVTSLLLAFRTNTAYDRYYEGRKLWSKLTSDLRTLTLGVWAGVDDSGNENTKETIDKITFLNLLIAFAFATKNYLRGEYSYDEELKNLIGHLPRFQTPSSNESLSDEKLCRFRNSHSKVSIDESSNFDTLKKTPEEKVECVKDGAINILKERAEKRKQEHQIRKKNLMAYDRITDSNIPMEISYYLLSYFRNVAAKQIKDHSLTKQLYSSLFSLVQCLTGFERILRTPIPLAYSIHLNYVTWLYLLALPYQILGQLNWITIPVVGLASFALLGILCIGWEIENPFGYDDNDLPLDDFCKVIKHEIQATMKNPMPTLNSWIMSEDNHPLSPYSTENARELSQKTMDQIRNILSQSTKNDSSFEESDKPPQYNEQL